MSTQVKGQTLSATSVPAGQNFDILSLSLHSNPSTTFGTSVWKRVENCSDESSLYPCFYKKVSKVPEAHRRFSNSTSETGVLIEQLQKILT